MKNNKVFKFFCSMQFCIILLAVILAACIKGSLVDNPTMYFKEWWLVTIAGLLCLNLILCSVSRFPVVLKKYRRAEKRKIGAFGSWLTHLGMLLVIVGFALGQFLSVEYTVYGIPGSTQPIGDSGYWLTIDDFEISMRDDYTVEQYTASLSVFDGSGKTQSGTASVNHPMSAFGFELFQDSTGWANYVDIYTNNEFSKTELLCAGEYTYPDDRPNLVFLINKFYPDLGKDSDGNMVTLSPICNNPYSLFTIYYNNEVMGMNVAAMEEAIAVNEYTFVLRDPVQYTLLVVKKDPTAAFVGFASLLVLVGIFMAFYYRPVYPKQAENAELLQVTDAELISDNANAPVDGNSEAEQQIAPTSVSYKLKTKKLKKIEKGDSDEPTDTDIN